MTNAKGAAKRAASTLLAMTCLVAAPAARAATALDLYYERTVMSAANSQCGLFAPSLGSALNAARAQARGAAMRSGVTGPTLSAVEQRAVGKVRAAGCASKDIALAAGRVRTAFDGFQKISSMNYPGDTAGWKAERAVSRTGPTWGLLQTTAFGWDKASVGLTAGDNALTALGLFADNARPYAARLVLRDAARAPQAYLDRRQADAAGRLPLAARLPPASATQVFNAGDKIAAPEGLLPPHTDKTKAKAAVAFRFPRAAADAVSTLDPREAVAVDFVFAGRTGDSVRRVYVEVGDFAAGRAFVQLAQN